MSSRRWPTALRVAVVLLGAGVVRAADGPGLPNAEYPPSQEGTIVGINNPYRAVSGITMHRGYLLVPMSSDHGGGRGIGALLLTDISDPARWRTHFYSRNHLGEYHVPGGINYLGDFSEAHHIPISGNHILFSERRPDSAGFAILDTGPLFDDDPGTLPQVVTRYSFPGVTDPGNYDGYSFAPGWQGNKLVWAPTGANGLYIVDTSTPGDPQLVRHFSRSQLGNMTLRTAIPIGNLLILASAAVNDTFGALVVDISDPGNPRQLNRFSGPLGYQPFVFGGKLYGGGTPLQSHDFSDPARIVTTTLNANPGLDRPLYGFGKDDHLFIGRYTGMTKWSLSQQPAQLVQTVDSGIADDHAFITPLGNLVALTSDHRNDRKIMIGIHDHEPDLTPPAVNFSSPADGETGVHVKSRVGLCFTDFIEPSSVDAASLVVREIQTGAPVAGSYSTMFGIVNFAPDEHLAVNTTYEVVLGASGITDQVGNAIAEETVVATFATGSVLSTYRTTVETDQPAEAGQVTAFSLAVENPAAFDLEHAWDFGDGSPLTPYSPSTTASHRYVVPGNHVVTAHTRIAGRTRVSRATGVQVIHAPLPDRRPVHSSSIIYLEASGLVCTVNSDNDSITAIDPLAERTYELPVGDHPVSIATGPQDTLWIVNKGDASLSVVSRFTGTVLRTHPLPPGSAPHGIVIDEISGTAWVALEATGEVAEIDTSTGAVVRSLAIGPAPRHLAHDPGRGHLWVSRFISPDERGEVHLVDTATFTRETTTSLAPVTDPDSLTNGRGLPNYLGAPAISPDATQAFVPGKKDNIFRGLRRDGQPLTFEHTVRSMAARIDLDSGLEDPSRRIDFDNSDFATAAAYSPLGNQLFFTTSGSAQVWVVDAYDATPAFNFSSGGLAPAGLVLSPAGDRLYVHNQLSRTVTIFDTAAVCNGICGTAPRIAEFSTVSQEKLPPEVLRGKQLFYDSRDPRLSQEGYMSCASCHLDGGHDGRTWDFTGFGEGLRNTIDLRGRGTGHGPVHWTANFDEVHDFEGQIRSLSQGSGLMDDHEFLYGSRSEPLGLAKAGISSDLDALAAYIASLTSVGVSPHRRTDGTLTPEAVAGRTLFRDKGCASCHGGPAFTDSASLARHDVGTLTGDSGQRLGQALDGLDTPTLRGLWASAPYLHDGSAPTLRDVLAARNLAGRHGYLFDLTGNELQHLEAYLLQIDDLEATAPAAEPGTLPALRAPAPQVGHLFDSVDLPLVVDAPGSGPFEFFATGLPPGVVLDRHRGVIAGALVEPGEFSVRVGMRNATGHSAHTSMSWTVYGSAVQLHESIRGMDPVRFIKLRALSALDGGSATAIAEINVLDEHGRPLDRNGWTASATNGPALAGEVLDGDPATCWHTPASQATTSPEELVIDMGSSRRISGIRHLPRSPNPSGRIADFELQTSLDGETWIFLARGSFPDELAEHTVLTAPMTGAITGEWWTGIPGTSVADLLNSPAFPASPDGTPQVSSFEAPSDWADDFGIRMHGFLRVRSSGEYTLAIASSDQGELWLSPSHRPSEARLIASVPTASNPKSWHEFPSQVSEPVHLHEGALYYLLALHKGGRGPDHLAVGGRLGDTGPFSVIPGPFLVPYGAFPFVDAPALPVRTLRFSVAEDAPPGTLAGSVTALDPDAGHQVRYRIVAGNSPPSFSIDPNTGDIRTAAPLDFEAQESHQLVVDVSDVQGAGSRTCECTIAVTNVFESAAEFVTASVRKTGSPYALHGDPAVVGPAADPDRDGATNALEVLFGTDPARPDPFPGVRFNPESTGADSFMTYEFDVDATADTFLGFRVFATSDLRRWEPLRNLPELLSTSQGRHTYRVQDHEPLNDDARRFIRVEIDPAGSAP